jgi:hypothetical protein
LEPRRQKVETALAHAESARPEQRHGTRALLARRLLRRGTLANNNNHGG